MGRPLQTLTRFFRELKRRNVYKVTAAYLVAAFVVLQLAGLAADAFRLPHWFGPMVWVVCGLGFPLALIVAWAFELSPEGLRRTGDLTQRRERMESGGTGSRPGRVAFRAFVALGILAAAVTGGWYLMGGSGGGGSGSELQNRSVAVLPFDNMSEDSEAEPFVKGMTEQLILELGQLGGLTLKSRTSVMRYEDTDKSLPQIAGELGADVLVEGSVLKAEDEVRITVRLLDAREDRYLWARDYRRGLRNVLDLQGEVARSVAREIGVELSPEEEEKLTEDRVVDPAAHEAYLRGLYYFRRGGPLGTGDSASAEMLRKSIESYREAIETDPTWAEPRAHLAAALHWLASGGTEPTRYYAMSKEAALEALELDESVSLAHGALAFVLHRSEWDFTGARRAYRRATELNPNEYTWGYALFLLSAGEYQQAIEYFRRAIERNPLSRLAKIQLALAHHCAGREREALDQLQRVTELYPDFARAYSLRGEVYQWLGRHEDALAELRRAAELRGVQPVRMPRLGVSLAATGRRDRALEVLGAVRESGAAAAGLPELYVALGDREAALRWFEEAVEDRNDELLYIRCRRWLMDRVGDDPDFQRLVDRVGFPPSR